VTGLGRRAGQPQPASGGRSVEKNGVDEGVTASGRRTRRRQGELGANSPLDMLENPGDDERAVNARDDLDRPAPALAEGHIVTSILTPGAPRRI